MSTIAKFLSKPPDGFSTQIASSTVASGALSISLDSTSGLPTEGVGQLFKKDANGDLIAGSVEFCHWTNVSGTTLTFSDTGDRGITGSDSGAQSYVADDYFEVWASSYYVGGVGGLIEHAADGTHDTTKVATLTATQTLTNKRVTPRIATVADAATITPTADSCDEYTVTALAQAATIAAPSGTPTNGQKLIIRILDNGTARALTWNAIYNVIGVTLPTTTVLSKYTYVGCIYNSANSKWDVLAVQTQA